MPDRSHSEIPDMVQGLSRGNYHGHSIMSNKHAGDIPLRALLYYDSNTAIKPFFITKKSGVIPYFFLFSFKFFHSKSNTALNDSAICGSRIAIPVNGSFNEISRS